MKQKAKSLLALILAMSLCLSMVWVPAYASDTDNIAVGDGATVIMAEEATDDADADDSADEPAADESADEAEADTPAEEAEADASSGEALDEAEADTSAEEAEEEPEADAPADEAEEESEADEPVDEADVSVVAAEDEDGEAADDTGNIVLTSEGGTLSSGSYILEADVTLETSLTIAEGETVSLDLNGYTLTGAASKSVITVSGAFTLTDSSSAGTGVVTGGSYTYGGGVYVTSGASFTMDGGAISGNSATSRGGGVYLEDSASFTLNDGEISNNYTVDNSSGGGGVCLYTNATFTMNGGKITNNTCNYTAIRSGSGGGGVYLHSGATFTMNDGEISNNVCNGGTSCNYGGGIFLNGNTTFTMNGGKITGNSTDANYGGGIGGYFGTTYSAIININGGEISGNSSGKYGGGIGVAASTATLNISGGTISGNTAGTSGGGVYLNSGANSVLNLSGGTITGNTAGTSGGGIFVNSTSSIHPTVNLSGNPVVSGNTAGDATDNIYLKTATQYLTLGELTSGASIGVTTASAPTDSATVQLTTAETETSYYASSAGYFSSDAGYYVDADAENGYLVLTTVEPTPAVDYAAENVTTSTSYETLQAAIDEASTGDEIAMLKDLTEDVTVASDDVITIDLAGYTLTGTGTTSVITVSGTLTLEDSSEAETGTVTGGVGSAPDSTLSTFICGGGVIVNDGTFTMNGGTITGNSANSCGGGVGVYGKSTFTMNGGTITGNSASGSSGKGGGVALRPAKTTKAYGATFIMNGGTISDNTAGYYGGGVSGYNGYTTMTINGGKITGNSAKYGGGIEVNAGSASASHSSLTITDGEISGNAATNGNGGGIYCTASYATLSIEGGTITGNTASGNGGGVSAETSVTLTMDGGTISGNTADNSGGGVYVMNGSAFTMSDGTISGNTASSASYYGGGGVLLYASGTSYPTFTMTGGSITGNTSGCYGGGISSYYGANTITITGGNVANNTADMAGDDLYGSASSTKATSLTLSITPTGTLACGHDIDGWYEDTKDARWSETNAVAVDTSETLTSASAAITLKAAHSAVEPDVDYVAQNVTTSTGYETLEAAFAAANVGDEIALLTDVTEDVTVASADVITLDLAGYTLTGTGTTSVIIVNGDLTLKDSSEAGTGTVTGGIGTVGTGTTSSGTFGGGVYVAEGAAFTLSSGAISGNTASFGGGGVYVAGNASFTMDGGTISGNEAAGYYGGGGVLLWTTDTTASVTFTMNGGAISGNSTVNGGGGISSFYGANTITINGGEISGNTADYYGGAVYLADYGTLNLNGGAITGNTAKFGGGIRSASAYCVLNLSGGSVTGNTATSSGGGIYLFGNSVGVSTMNVSGNVVITGNTAGTDEETTVNNLYLTRSDAYITLGELTEGASIGVTTYTEPTDDAAVQFTATETETTYYASSVDYFSSDAGYVVAVNESGYLELAVEASADYVAQNVTTSTSYETLQAAINEASSGDEIALLTDVAENVTVASGDVITLDLAGYTLTGSEDTSVITVKGGDLTLKDSSEDGSGVIASNSAGTYYAAGQYFGAGVYVYSGAFTMESGTISGIDNEASAGNGAGVYVGNSSGTSATFTMNGGTISDNHAKYASGSGGGGVYLTGEGTTFYMNGGTIANNSARNSGGGVYISSATFIMTGGTITGNSATGTSSGNGGGIGTAISDTTKIYLSGGAITGNTAVNAGGGIFVNSSTSKAALVSISGDIVISGNTASDAEDNVYLKTTNQLITLGELAEGASIGVTTKQAPTDDAAVQITTAETETTYYTTSAGYFTSDEGYAVKVNEEGGYLELGTIVPVAQNVTTSATYTTLQAAIDEASSGDEVALLMNLTEDVTVASDDVITLDLAGYTLTGTGTTSVITVNGALTLEDSSEDGTGIVTGGSAKYGGGVYVEEGASFTLTSGTISGNTATNTGGGVYLTNATFTMTGGIISGNTGTSYGGGVGASGGTIEITGGKVTDNTSKYGGGVRGNLNTTTTISDCEISGNTGGGVFTIGSLTMTGCTVSDNTASGMGGGVRSGAALTLTNCVITGNTASGYSGGGVYAGAELTMSGCTVSGNTGTNGGGVYASADLTMTDCVVSGNTSTNGGGLYLGKGSTASVSDSSIDNNTADTAGDDIYAVSNASKPVSLTLSGTPTGTLTACGHDITGWYDDSEDARWAEDNATAVDTSAALTSESAAIALKAAHSAIVYVAQNVTTTTYYTTLQAAIDEASSGDELTILMDLEENVTIESKTLTLDLAGYTLTASTGSTSTVTVGGTSADTAASLTLKDSSEEGTGTLAGTGSSCSYGVLRINTTSTVVMESGTITGGKSTSMGGGVYVGKSSTFTMNGGSITGNTGNMGGGVYVYTDGEFVLNDGAITGNSTYYTTTGTRGGGGVYLADSSIFTMNGGSITNNTSDDYAGGGVYVYGQSTFTMNGGTISGNTSTSGGGVYVYSASTDTENSAFILNGGSISGNTSTGYGGGVYIGASNSTYVASFTMTGGEISNNTSGSYGGGVATYTGVITIDITGGTISGNSATGYGGGIYAGNRTTVSIANCAVTDNSATRYGGGVYAYTSLTMTGCTVSGNTGTYGGGLYLYTGCAATISDSSIANNTATTAGDDIYANASSSKPLALTLSGTPSGTLSACGHDIDGWYSDSSSSRWAEDNAVAVDTTETLTATSALALKAAHSAVEVEFAIVTHPEDVTAEKGSIATFTVVATGTGLTYQWQYQTATGSKWYNCTATTGEGYASDSVTLTANAGRDGYKYRCVVTNGDGETLTSDAAELTVTTPVVVDPISITTQPADVTAEKGSTATFTVEAVSNLDEALTYQWQYKTASGTSWNNCTATTGTGYNDSTLTLTANKGRDGYSYRCKITDASGNTAYSDAATLTVTTPEVVDTITVTTQPTDVTAEKGDSVTLTVEATSNLGETLTYQWQYQTATGSKWYNCTATTGEGYASASVTLTANKGRNGYKYRCKITDESGNVVYTDVITLTVTTAE